VSVHKFILGTNLVSSAEISNFLQGQGNRGITRPAIGREQIILQIDEKLREMAISAWKKGV
jgi:hypothetical protein